MKSCFNKLRVWFLIFGMFSSIKADGPRLLIKIPTRSRPEQFFMVLDKFYAKLSGEIPYHFLITCDVDDTTMNNEHIINRLNSYVHLTYQFGRSKSKIEAYNYGIAQQEFDILLAASDDMEPIVDGYDKIITQAMLKHFPDLDGILNYKDGYTDNSICNVMPIVGKKFFNRFGYLYYPGYVSLFCDNEIMLVSRILNKEAIFSDVIIRHNHPYNINPVNPDYDTLYLKNNDFYRSDMNIFNSRRERLFDIPKAWLDEVTPKLWSILICTIDERQAGFQRLYSKLAQQIKTMGLEDQVEILFFRDKRGEHTIGHKRNVLLHQSKGKYVNFLDDDDDVHKNYIKMIFEKLNKNPDVVSLVGLLKTGKKKTEKFVHSVKYKKYSKKGKTYYRPPNHLNTMKRHIAIQYLFPEINYGEDTRWAMMIANKKLLKIESKITQPYYFYLKK